MVMYMKKKIYEKVDLNLIIGKENTVINEFIKYRGATNFDDIEIESLKKFALNLDELNRRGFILSYKISHIDKEFDLIKLGNKYLFDIEMKNSNRSEKDRLNQARDNYKILKRFYNDYNIYVISYISTTNSLFIYDNRNDIFVKTNSNDLNQHLSLIEVDEMIDIDFKIKNVYQEPFFFMNDLYTLSNSQRDIKELILNDEKSIITIEGKSGVGKSLLAMDLYKHYLDISKALLLIPAAKTRIIDNELLVKYPIQMAREFINNYDGTEYDVIIIDEAQRLLKTDLEIINKRCKKLILFYDMNQNIDGVIDDNDLHLFIEINKSDIKKYKLKQCIRNDGTFLLFSNKVLNLNNIKKDNLYFDPLKLKIYMISDWIPEILSDYVFLNFTYSKFNSCHNKCSSKKCIAISNHIIINGGTSKVIHFACSNEFDKVAIYLCDKIFFDENGIKSSLEITYGDLKYQLYTMITRARDSLIIICDEIETYNFLKKCQLDLCR